MRARLVDWTLFVLVMITAITGLGSWLIADTDGALIFLAHAAAGLALVIPLAWKFKRVEPRLTHKRAWDWKTPVSILASLAIIGTIASGVVWTHFQQPVGYPNGMHLHIVFAIALVLLIVLHTALRFKLPTRRDVFGRREALRWLGMVGFGAAVVPVQDIVNRAFGLPGAHRRFTGSRNAGDDTGNALPITNWLFDAPAPIDVSTWRLSVNGAVGHALELTYADCLAARDSLRVTLDCTGGWHSTQDWRGVRVGDLLDRANVQPNARFVSFVSVTGYRWSLPLAEARAALLATHVADEPLAHWHGAPLRLVAPGRRGFMWVKWVREVVVLAEPDAGQWTKIFTSGVDR